MPQRLKKYLKRFLILILALGLLGLIAFWVIAYSPFEGDAEDLASLVPDDVEFFLRLDYEDLADRGWVQNNILQDAFLPAFAQVETEVRAPSGRTTTRVMPIDQWWTQQIESLEAEEARINDQIPLGIVDFEVATDLAPGEVVVAGRWCEAKRPPDPPSWQELLILKRLPFKSRVALAAFVNNGWVQDMVSQQNGMRVEEIDSGVLKLTLPGIVPTSELARSGCGRGYVMEPENVWYLYRHLDVAMLANSERLILSAVDLTTKAVDARASFAARPGFDTARRPGTVHAAVDLEPVQEWGIRFLETLEAAGRPPQRLVSLRGWGKLNGYLSFESPNQLVGRGSILMKEGGLSGASERMFDVAPGPMKIGLASWVPNENTFLYCAIHMEPRDLFRAMLSGLSGPDRLLWERNLVKVGHYNKLEDFFDEMASWCGTECGVALARLDEQYNPLTYADWFGDDADPFPGVMLSARIGPGKSAEEVRGYLADRVKLMGLVIDQELTHEGIPYTRLKLKDLEDIRDFPFLSPCFALVQDTILIGNNEDYFRQVLDTMAGKRKSLADGERFQVTMNGVRDTGHLAFFLDLERFYRIPENPEDPKGMPQGFQWDHRNLVVTADRDTVTEGAKKRNEFRRQLQRQSGRIRLTEEQEAEVERRVEAYVDGMIDSYPDYVREYWEHLKGFRRLGSLAAVLAAVEGSQLQRLELEGNLILRDAEPWARPK